MVEKLSDEQLLKYESFYSNINDLHLSASSLKLLIESPKKYFKHYVLDEKDIKTGKHFDEGSLVHCMVLEPEELNSKFINMGISTPTESTKMCLDYLISLEKDSDDLEDYAEEILNYLKDVNLHQSLVDDKKSPFKTGDEKRIDKIINENSISYFKIMIAGKTKTIVDSVSWEKCYEKATAILENKKAKELLSIINSDDEIRFEIELSDKLEDLEYGIKGILDAIKVDRKNKVIYVSDIKTHSGKLKDFAEASIKYNYWLQPILYKLLAQSLLRGKAFDYKIIFHYIVVDQNNDVYCFPVEESSMMTYYEQLYTIINTKIAYHIKNKDFNLPYEFANNLISL